MNHLGNASGFGTQRVYKRDSGDEPEWIWDNSNRNEADPELAENAKKEE
jgi:hypothetical protein